MQFIKSYTIAAMKKTLHASIVAVSLFAGTFDAFAKPSGFELDLKELRSTSPAPLRAPQARKQEPRKTVRSSAAVVHGESSSYTVQPGDHLFLILMRQYGLSNDAAERLIPEVMSINNIHNPRGLTRGMRLTIPLAARVKQMAEPVRIIEKVAVLKPAAEPPSPAVKPLRASAEPAHKGIEILAAPSCSLGKEFAEKFALLVPSIGIIQGFPNFTVSHAGLTLAVACGLSPEEAYTYAQLLARRNVQLLVFDEDEPHRRVIEKIANRLNLFYELDETAGRNKLPLKVRFTSVGADNREMKLTILAGNN